jgi:FkbM family methyltransferase
MVFDQIFVEHEYWPLDGLKEVRLVIDCGANVGYSSTYFLSAYQQAFVIAVEPEDENYKVLLSNLQPYRNRCEAVQAAVWPTHEKVTLKKRGKSRTEWGHRVEKLEREAKERAIPSVTIPELIEMSRFDRVSILKVDIEGAEVRLFGESVDWLDLVDNIVIELHGAQSREIFFRAINKRDFDILFSGELTICIKR